MKKLIYVIILFFLFSLFFLIQHLNTVYMLEVINPKKEHFTPNKINASVYFTHLSNKEFELTDENLVKELVEFLSNIKVRKSLIKQPHYIPKLMETYRLTIYSKEGKEITIFIRNNNYVDIRGQNYKIICDVDLSKIYKIILEGQDRNSIDEFYFDIIQ